MLTPTGRALWLVCRLSALFVLLYLVTLGTRSLCGFLAERAAQAYYGHFW